MRFLVAMLAYIASVVVTAVAMFFSVMFLAGPHGGVLPASLHTATLALAWLIVLVIPLLVARWTWRRQPRT